MITDKRRIFYVLLSLVIITGIYFVLTSGSTLSKIDTSYNLFSLVVVDVNNDKKLDVMTTNHNADTNTYLNKKNCKFGKKTTKYSIPHVIGTKDYADVNRRPINEDSIYAYRYRRNAYITNSSPGQLKFYPTPSDSINNTSTISYSSTPMGTIGAKKASTSKTLDYGETYQFNLQEASSSITGRIVSGATYVTNDLKDGDVLRIPALQDFHGLSTIAPLDSFGYQNSFVSTRSGVPGNINKFRERSNNHFLLQKGGIFLKNNKISAYEENICRSHQLFWYHSIDEDSPTLVLLCNSGKFKSFTLFRDSLEYVPERFRNLTPPFEEGSRGHNTTAYLTDLDNNKRLDVVQWMRGAIYVYLRKEQRFIRKRVCKNCMPVKPSFLSINESSNLGKLFAVSPVKSMVFSLGETIERRPFPNLPQYSTGIASISDNDNSILLFPHGIYKKEDKWHQVDGFDKSGLSALRTALTDCNANGKPDIILSEFNPRYGVINTLKKFHSLLPATATYLGHIFHNILRQYRFNGYADYINYAWDINYIKDIFGSKDFLSVAVSEGKVNPHGTGTVIKALFRDGTSSQRILGSSGFSQYSQSWASTKAFFSISNRQLKKLNIETPSYGTVTVNSPVPDTLEVEGIKIYIEKSNN